MTPTSRRLPLFARAAAALLATLALAACGPRVSEISPNATVIAAPAPLEKETADLKVVPDWRPHFDDLSKGAILVNLPGRWLVYWEPGGEAYHAFPIATPLNEDLARTGSTRVVRKKENPEWRPTEKMLQRNPDLPLWIGPGPHNPLGERAMYLGWQYYAIHGTNDPGRIGTQASSGCIRMLNDDVEWLYEQVLIGTPVVVTDVPIDG